MLVDSQTLLSVGAITAALIAGAFSFLNLVISKEQKISEFRQNWIDELRKEISSVVASVSHLVYRLDAKEPRTTEEAFKLQSEIRESHETAERCTTSIQLRINPADPDQELRLENEFFLESLMQIQKSFNAANAAETRKCCDVLIKAAQPILKHEWNRVKRGETVYRYSKYTAASILAVATFAALAMLASILGR